MIVIIYFSIQFLMVLGVLAFIWNFLKILIYDDWTLEKADQQIEDNIVAYMPGIVVTAIISLPLFIIGFVIYMFITMFLQLSNIILGTNFKTDDF